MTKHRAIATGATTFTLALVCAANLAWGQAVMSRLGVGENDARGIANSAIDGSYGYGRMAKPFLMLPPAARASTVTESITWAKMYFNSAAFKKVWADKREGAKPAPPKASASADDQISQNNAALKKQIDDMRKVAASLPPDQRKAIETAIQQITAQSEAAAKDPKMQALQRQAIDANRAGSQKKYEDDLKKWGEDFPADPSAIIARRLHEFLAACSDVNFDAKLAARGGGKYFTDEQYERKPSDWKICYRAGREATSAARAGATAWLKELGK